MYKKRLDLLLTENVYNDLLFLSDKLGISLSAYVTYLILQEKRKQDILLMPDNFNNNIIINDLIAKLKSNFI